jgi:heme A synthase
MPALHGLGASIVLGAGLLFVIGSALLSRRGGSPWVDRAGMVVAALLAAEAVLGAITWLGGNRPRESLHYLYAVAALATLPIAATFASEAPPRPRAVVMAVAGALLVILTWRLASTG